VIEIKDFRWLNRAYCSLTLVAICSVEVLAELQSHVIYLKYPAPPPLLVILKTY